MTVICDARLQTAELDNSHVGRVKSAEPQSDSHISVTVLFTTREGTLAALRSAEDLARNLGLQIALTAMEVVSFHFSFDHPPVSVNFLKQRLFALVSDSGVNAEKISVKLYFCRDHKHGLQQLLAPNSLVIIGGEKHWWRRQERKLAQYLRSLGHRVILADVRSKSRSRAQSPIHSR